MALFPAIPATTPCNNRAAPHPRVSGIAVPNLPSLLHFLTLVRGSAIGSTPAFGAGYPGSSPGPGAKPFVVAFIMNTPDLALGAIWYIVFLFSTTCHEAAHALVAKLGGDTTAAEGGQVTLNPIPHIRRTPFGMVVVPILSYLVGGWMIGWASAPFNPAWQREYPRRSGWMALAGPAANFSLMILAGIAIRIGLAAGFFQAPEAIHGYAGLVVPANAGDPTFLTSALSILFILNLLLGTFNLLPVPPLDGHAGIMVLMPEGVAHRHIDWVQRSRNFALLGLIVAWSLFDRIFQPVFLFALRTLYAGVHNG
jgi:Zn-dependent protease